jgi:small conductance mechanosensitive channel
MEPQLQNILNRIKNDVSSHAQTWIPTPRKLDFESLISAATVMIGFWILSIIARVIADRFFVARKIDEALSRFLMRVIRFSLLCMGLVTALGTLGVDVSAIVAGLGLTGLALGIALKDIVSNAVSGIMLLIFRPFRHRDRIKVADFEGDVIDIDMRYTHLLCTDMQIIFIPNSLLFANAVTVTKSSQVKPEVQSQTHIKHIDHAPSTPKARKNILLALVSEEPEEQAA